MRYLSLIVLLSALSACSPSKLLTIGVNSDEFTRYSDISYQPGNRHTLTIYKPVSPAPGNPVIVFFYGGGWTSGSKEQIEFVAEPLAEAGMTVVVPDYRLSPEVTFPAFIDDGATAVQWTYNHIGDYGGDSKKLFVMGHSAGAYIAVMLATDPEYLAKVDMKPADITGVMGIAGPYNFLPITWKSLKPIFEIVPDLSITQPITFADGKNPPMFLVAGEDDETVDPIRNTDAMYQRVLANHGKVTERLYPDVGHIGIILAFSPTFRGNAPVLQDAVDFVKTNSHVKN